ncbi:hypothetical protein Shyd_56910 [Streptomyces hydrogenans]|uniref:ABC transporter domain-containing protein n=1 Tax=Streptomyces hydrogenans TaxID=1873719 RepID=A0ABQ3PH34_9ACTN|nr:hypothetical protein Shyd_56910 [Streptomyces hydrogenans]
MGSDDLTTRPSSEGEGGEPGADREAAAHGAALVVEGLGLKGPRGWAFREVSFRAGAGSLVALEGPSGSGRTCLLLALTGRMRTHGGHAEVGGLPLPRRMAAVRRIAALGQVPGVSELDPSLTVAEHLRERALLQRRFDGSVRALLRRPGTRAAEARARIDEALACRRPGPGRPAEGRADLRTGPGGAWRRCGCRSRWPSSAGRDCSAWTTRTSSCRTPTGPRPGRCCARWPTPAPPSLAVCSEAPADALRITTVAADADTTGESAEPAPAGQTADTARTGTRHEDQCGHRDVRSPREDHRGARRRREDHRRRRHHRGGGGRCARRNWPRLS